MQSATGKLNTDNDVLSSEIDMSLCVLVQNKAEIMYALRHRCMLFPGQKIENLDTGNQNDNWENKT